MGEVGRLHLPQKFGFEQFLPLGTPQSPSNLTVYARISGQATSLSPGATSKTMLPTLPERTPVVDRRLPPKTNAERVGVRENGPALTIACKQTKSLLSLSATVPPVADARLQSLVNGLL